MLVFFRFQLIGFHRFSTLLKTWATEEFVNVFFITVKKRRVSRPVYPQPHPYTWRGMEYIKDTFLLTQLIVWLNCHFINLKKREESRAEEEEETNQIAQKQFCIKMLHK